MYVYILYFALLLTCLTSHVNQYGSPLKLNRFACIPTELPYPLPYLFVVSNRLFQKASMPPHDGPLATLEILIIKDAFL